MTTRTPSWAHAFIAMPLRHLARNPVAVAHPIQVGVVNPVLPPQQQWYHLRVQHPRLPHVCRYRVMIVDHLFVTVSKLFVGIFYIHSLYSFCARHVCIFSNYVCIEYDILLTSTRTLSIYILLLNIGCHWCHEFQANHEIRVCDRCDAFYCRGCDEMDQCEDCSEVVCNTCSTLMSCKFCGCGLCEDCATACGR